MNVYDRGDVAIFALKQWVDITNFLRGGEGLRGYLSRYSSQFQHLPSNFLLVWQAMGGEAA